MNHSLLALSLALIASTSTAAETETRQHDAHEHGVAEMNLIWEGNTININIESPAFNIVGFEHQVESHEQEEAVEAIEKTLNMPEALFSFGTLTCKATEADIESPFEYEDHEEHKKHEDHGHHDEHEKHEGHEEHKESESHSEYDINYSFTCENISHEVTISAAELFKQLPKLDKVKVQWISKTQQSSAVLSKENSVLLLK